MRWLEAVQGALFASLRIISKALAENATIYDRNERTRLLLAPLDDKPIWLIYERKRDSRAGNCANVM